jgi:hypothetical protein
VYSARPIAMKIGSATNTSWPWHRPRGFARRKSESRWPIETLIDSTTVVSEDGAYWIPIIQNVPALELSMARRNAHDRRIAAIVTDDEEYEQSLQRFFEHLEMSLELPCEVTRVERFNWEEFYLNGPGDAKEYKRFRKSHPSYRDTFELLAIETGVSSEWMMYEGEDIGARVRRKSDGREFCLGLAELTAVDKKSKNYQLLDDYSVWFVNDH